MDYELKYNFYITMDVLKIMLQQRGIATDVVEPIETDFPATVSKIGAVMVFMSSRARISDKDVDAMIALTQKNGSTLTICVVPVAPSPTVLTVVRQKSDKFQLFHIGQLQFDITTHRKVPRHRILTKEERDIFMAKYHIQDTYTQMPLIDSQDMGARWIGAKPGDILEIMRKSETAGGTPYYRLCVADVTL
jgi:DNA-directed RNA polymerase subunit H (RpoH/RPB5)